MVLVERSGYRRFSPTSVWDGNCLKMSRWSLAEEIRKCLHSFKFNRRRSRRVLLFGLIDSRNNWTTIEKGIEVSSCRSSMFVERFSSNVFIALFSANGFSISLDIRLSLPSSFQLDADRHSLLISVHPIRSVLGRHLRLNLDVCVPSIDMEIGGHWNDDVQRRMSIPENTTSPWQQRGICLSAEDVT